MSRRAAKEQSAAWFGWVLVGVAVLALAVRVTYIVGWHGSYTFGGDQYYYHAGANLLADGKGFISPFSPHHAIAASDHPPLYMLYLAIPSVLGFQSVLAHLVWSAVLGTGTVVLVGLTGRAVGGPRLGIIAAVLAAIYPNVWASDGLMRSESMAMFTVALMLYLAYRYWRRPTWWGLAAIGVAGAAAALSRAELVLLIPLIVVPLALLAPGVKGRARGVGIVAGFVAAFVLMSPWLVFNLTRFDKPELLTTSLGPMLSSTSCDKVWKGDFKSYYEISCSQAVEARHGKPGQDESEVDATFRRAAFDYIGNHTDLIPEVFAARVGAILGLYRPDLQNIVESNRGPEKPELFLVRAERDAFYVMALLAIVGVVVLRRRRALLFPLLIPPLVVVLTVMLSYAAIRFRAPAEISLCILAAAAIDAAINRFRPADPSPDTIVITSRKQLRLASRNIAEPREPVDVAT